LILYDFLSFQKIRTKKTLHLEGQKGDDITPFDGTYRKKSENKEATERLLIDNSCVTDP